MSLYEAIDETYQGQLLKTDTGDTLIIGVLPGVVTQNTDPQFKGRVCVRLPVRDEDGNELQWARIAMPSSGKSWGHYFVPELEDVVLLAFEGGCIEKPYVIGCVPKDNSQLVSKRAGQKNEFKCITATSGSTLLFCDTEQRESVSLYTAEQSHQLLLDNGKKEVQLGDKALDNGIRIQTEAGKITIKAANKLVIEVGSVTLTINGSSGTVKLEAGKLDVSASSAISLNSSGKLKLSGVNAKLEASSALQLESNGLYTLSAKLIKNGS